jgi:FkbM family methyltransferase
MSLIKRSIQLFRDEGPSGLAKGAYRLFWWNGGMDIEYYIRSLFDRPAKREIRGESTRFIIGSKGELKRVTTFSSEKPVLEWFIHQIKSSDVVWDIGANIGTYSLFASSFAEQVVAFEPHPANINRLQENANLNKSDIDIRSIALSDEEGTAHLDVSKEHAGAGGGSVSAEGSYEISLKKGDEIIPRPDLVKIDVEGHEFRALKGMTQALQNVRCVLIELHENDDLEDIEDLLQANSFETEVRWEIGTRQFIIGERKS